VKPLPTPEQFVAELTRWGIPFRQVAGWETRNHNDRQPFQGVEFLLVHHTGDDAPDDADLNVLTNGRPGLAGPLCCGGIRDDGTLDLVSWGTAYHAGSGSSRVLAAVLAGSYGDYPPAPGPDDTNGNPISLGWETMYSGLHAPTTAAYATLVKVNAALCTLLGLSQKHVIGHKEWTSRKVDPGHLDMAQFRRDVRTAINAGPPAGKDWFDMATPKDLQDAVFVALTDPTRDIIPSTEWREPLLQHQSVAGTILAAARASTDASSEIDGIGKRVARLQDAVTALTASTSALAAALQQLQTDVTAALGKLPAAGQ
jgi:hypothetical protein